MKSKIALIFEIILSDAISECPKGDNVFVKPNLQNTLGMKIPKTAGGTMCQRSGI